MSHRIGACARSPSHSRVRTSPSASDGGRRPMSTPPGLVHPRLILPEVAPQRGGSIQNSPAGLTTVHTWRPRHIHTFTYTVRPPGMCGSQSQNHTPLKDTTRGRGELPAGLLGETHTHTHKQDIKGFTQKKGSVQKHRGEPGHTRDRGHAGHTDHTETNLTTIPTHQDAHTHDNATGKQTPGGAGTHTGHTGAHGHTVHTDEPHKSQAQKGPEFPMNQFNGSFLELSSVKLASTCCCSRFGGHSDARVVYGAGVGQA